MTEKTAGDRHVTDKIASARIDVWNEHRLVAGGSGGGLRFFNVLGRLASVDALLSLGWETAEGRGGELRSLNVGPDGARLADPGDFNIEIPVEDIAPEGLAIRIVAEFADIGRVIKRVEIRRQPNATPLPFATELGPEAIGNSVSVIDGLWSGQGGGLRIASPYYDRVLAIGDPDWKDYSVLAEVSIHGWRRPVEGTDLGANVVHVAVAPNWRGQTPDGHQPARQWYPLGVTCEFHVQDFETRRFGFRMLDPGEVPGDPAKSFKVPRDARLSIRAGAWAAGGDRTLYACRAWPAGAPEPEAWDLVHLKPDDTNPTGGVLLIAHYTDATFHRVQVEQTARPALPEE
ncbi:MAG: hypothetical protein QNJ13_15525 [Paracoccaceae bacterium]|nr:hypothetical protein [Paracoccaceae bacterium]